MQKGEVELNVPVNGSHADGSLWQKQGKKKVPPGFWGRKLPEAGNNYTPFEKQLLACYWALMETEQLTIGYEVVLHPEIPIVQWVRRSPKAHWIGHAPECGTVKWKWYIRDRAKVGTGRIATLHEPIAAAPGRDQEVSANFTAERESPGKWEKPSDQLMPQEKEHAWFTDGSAKYIGGKRFWKAVADHPHSEKFLEMTREGKSSQYAEFYAIDMALKQEDLGECLSYTASWSVAKWVRSVATDMGGQSLENLLQRGLGKGTVE